MQSSPNPHWILHHIIYKNTVGTFFSKHIVSRSHWTNLVRSYEICIFKVHRIFAFSRVSMLMSNKRLILIVLHGVQYYPLFLFFLVLLYCSSFSLFIILNLFFILLFLLLSSYLFLFSSSFFQSFPMLFLRYIIFLMSSFIFLNCLNSFASFMFLWLN